MNLGSILQLVMGMIGNKGGGGAGGGGMPTSSWTATQPMAQSSGMGGPPVTTRGGVMSGAMTPTGQPTGWRGALQGLGNAALGAQAGGWGYGSPLASSTAMPNAAGRQNASGQEAGLQNLQLLLQLLQGGGGPTAGLNAGGGLPAYQAPMRYTQPFMGRR